MPTAQEKRSTRELRSSRRASPHAESSNEAMMSSNAAARASAPAPAPITAHKTSRSANVTASASSAAAPLRLDSHTTTTTTATANTNTNTNTTDTSTNYDATKRGHKRPTRNAQDSQKKAKSSESVETVRTYNLRSASRGAPPAVSTVTPGTLVRQLDFQESRHSSLSTESNASAKANKLATDELPEGVVDIFSTRPAVQSCTCLHDVSFQLNSSLGFSHIANYGKEYGQILREKEEQEMCDLYTVLPPQSANGSPDGDSDLSDDESRPGTPRPGTVLKYRPRNLSMRESRSGPSENIEKLPRQPLLSPKMRSILVNWLVEVSQEYKVSADGYHLAITLLDLILTRGPTAQQLTELDIEDSDDEEEEESKVFLVLRNEFQALGCACAWIGSKMEDKDSPSYDDLVYISDHSFSSEKLRQLETRICKELEFRLHRVTPLHFVNEYLRASHACTDRSCEFDHSALRQMVMYLLELGRIPYELSIRKPSLLAASALYLARATLGLRESCTNHAVDRHGYWTKTLQHYTGYSVGDLKSTVLTIHQYHLAAEESNYNASFNKYRSRSFKAVSLKTALRVEDLGFDAPEKHEDIEIDESGARYSTEAA